MSAATAVGPEEAPAPRRGRAVAVAVAVVGVGLVLGGGAAGLLAGDDEPAPGDDEVRLAVASQFGLAPDAVACVLTHLDAAGALDDGLAASLVDDALTGTPTSSPAVVDAVSSCGRDRLLETLVAAGVPEVVATCAADTLADQPAGVQAALLAAPLQAGAPGRVAVSACALEHLAASVEAGAGIAGTDARCVAGEVIDRLGLELVLTSIGALAVTDDVSAAAAAAAETCAP